MKKEHIILPANPADPEDRDVSIEGMERGHRARLIRKARTDLVLSQTRKNLLEVLAGLDQLGPEDQFPDVDKTLLPAKEIDL